ncbi:MAG TPA: ribose-phosphate pyrophosphokinase-like domain-containing protein, partial [Acidimicrobiales bacterium]|nr:ribose-phosphate pyrophosphokinase-like domain-containing protein [Acidimicrobiales bacterium]
MELVTRKRLELFTGRSNPELAASVASALGVELGETNLSQFANGEM